MAGQSPPPDRRAMPGQASSLDKGHMHGELTRHTNVSLDARSGILIRLVVAPCTYQPFLHLLSYGEQPHSRPSTIIGRLIAISLRKLWVS